MPKDNLIERLRKYRGGNTEYRDLMDESIAELTRKQDLIEEMVEGLRPFAEFIEQYDRRPLRSADEFYAIHMGTEFEASLRLSECRRARTLITKATEPDRG